MIKKVSGSSVTMQGVVKDCGLHKAPLAFAFVAADDLPMWDAACDSGNGVGACKQGGLGGP